MLQLSAFYKHYERTSLDSVYEALRNKDLSDCVVLAVKILKEDNNFISFDFKKKSTSVSLEYGIAGKKAFCEGDYQMALAKYNVALKRAPPNSEAMRLTYYSRAELLLKTEQFSACVKDIDTCLALNCPDSFVTKLQQMKAEACQYAWVEQLALQQLSTPFTEQFFKLKGGRNPDIPCASSDVEVVLESGKPKVVAAKDIPVGTVLAVETSFMSATQIMNHVTSCHYCLKMSLNLIPCDGCCSALFCDKQCKEKANREGHNVECKIIDMVVDDIKLPVKAVFKIRQMCSSWDEFITASNDLGTERMKNSAFAEIFGFQKFSLLNSHYDTHFIYGAMFNKCLYFANIIHYLDTHTSFLPNSPEDKDAAIRAVSRMMMHLSLYCTPVRLQHCVNRCSEGQITLHNYPNKGYFPFIGNLANSCLPNTYVVGLRNSAALLAITPIKKGTELTFSYIGHWLEVLPSANLKRAIKLFRYHRTICDNCVVCRDDDRLRKQPLDEKQKKEFLKFSAYNATANTRFPQNVQSYYKEACKMLQSLTDAPCSEENVTAIASFVKCLIHCIHVQYPNVIMNQY